MSPSKVLLIELGVGGLPNTTPPLVISSTWAPAVYTPPPLAVPAALTAFSIAEGAVLTWTPTPGSETVIEIAPDSSGTPGTWAYRAQTADITHMLPMTYGSLRWVRIKAMRNGRSSDWSTPVLAAPLMYGSGAGRNLVGNNSFEINTSGPTAGTNVTDGVLCNLFQVAQPATLTTYARLSTTGARTGSRACQITLGGQSLANGAQLFSTRVDYVGPLWLTVSRPLLVRAYVTMYSNSSLLGCALTVAVIVEFLNGSGTVIGSIMASTANQAHAGMISARGTVPAGATRSRLVAQVWITNSTGSTQVLSGIPAEAYIDDVEVFHLSDLDEDVADGSVHGRIAMADVFQVSGVNRLGVAVSTSGQQVTPRNLPSTVPASGGALWDGLTITSEYDDESPANILVDATAATLRASGHSPSYSASSAITTQARGTTVRYYAYYVDATMAGGTKSLMLTTDRLAIVNAADRVFLDTFTITVPASGFGAGGGGGTGGGGGGYIP